MEDLGVAALPHFTNGLQIFGAVVLAISVLRRNRAEVRNEGMLRVSAFVVPRESMELAGRSHLARFLGGEWSEAVAGTVLLALGFVLQELALLMDAPTESASGLCVAALGIGAAFGTGAAVLVAAKRCGRALAQRAQVKDDGA